MHVLATAGHVDHGKSTLVRALTGMEPDRLPEEHRRGLTIDLGYAWTSLPSGEQVAFVDVPGHQRFIATMLAGLGPAPAVLFVVAADAGWARQSAEHLAAIDALGVRHGLLAVTRSDLADPATALTRTREELAASSLGEVEAVCVSGRTGEGLDELRAALDRLVASLPAPDRQAAVRLWVDRSFSIRGAGTVVTGTLSGGTVAVGDRLTTGSQVVTVRGLQSADVAHDRVGAVARVALNLRGVDAGDIARGDVLLTPERWHRTATVDVRLNTSERAAGERAAGERLPGDLVLHVGTAAVPVRIRPLGDGATARLGLAAELPLRAGDRGVLRDPGRRRVAAGVLILDADPPSLRRRGAAASRAGELADASGRPDPTTEVMRRGAVPRAHLDRLGVDTSGVPDIGGWLVAPARLERWAADAPARLDEWTAAHPLEPGMPPAALRHVLDVPDALLDTVVAAAGLHVRDGRVSRPGVTADLGASEAAVRTVTERLTRSPFDAPERDDLAVLRLGPRELAAAERAGRLRRISPDIVLLPDAPQTALATLRALPQPFTLSAARHALGTTRRVAVPLLEHLDGLGLTERVDGTRRRVR